MENESVREYGGFWIRFVAHIIDQIILGIINSILFIPIAILFGLSALPFDLFEDSAEFSSYTVHSQDFSEHEVALLGAVFAGILAFSITAVIISWLYYTLMQSSIKQATLGKMAMGLKVTDEAGKRISFGRATGRYFAKILSGIVLMIGYIMAGFTQKKQALHDILAGTVVIKP